MSVAQELDSRWIGAVIHRDQWHFHRQLLARYGIVLAPGEFSLIVAAITDGRARLVERRGRRKRQSIYCLRIPSCADRIYVLAAGARLITAWPPERRLNLVRHELHLSPDVPA
jgi:hypothetical protein